MSFNKIIYLLIKSSTFIILALPALLQSQTTGIPIDKTYDNLLWEEFVEKVEKNSRLTFFYNPEYIPDFRISVGEDNVSLKSVLENNLETYGLEVAIDKSGHVFLTRDQAIITHIADDFFEGISADSAQAGGLQEKEETEDFLKTSKEHVAKTIVVGTKEKGMNSKKATVSGQLQSSVDGSVIIGATLFIEELETGTATGEAGFYILELKKGKYNLTIRSLNFKEEKYELEVLSDGRVDFSLEPKLIELKGVTVRSDRENIVLGTQMGVERLSVKSIKEIPLVLGERDIVKVATLLPGIQSVGEGSAGFNVRGSPADQNLFYINKVPVYNTSHMFGFFSAFNSEAIGEFSLSKSNIPTRFGGRLASIFDISARQGNQKKYAVRGGISPITGRILVEGPIQKEKSSFLIGARSTYSDWILGVVKDPDFKNSSAYFADAIANLTFEVNPNNRIKAFGYYSLDKIDFNAKTKYDYGNLGASVSWSHFFENKHHAELSLIYSKYDLYVENEELDLQAYKNETQLEHKEARLDFTIRPGDSHNLTFGANSILYDLDQGGFHPFGDRSVIEPMEFGTERGLETGAYVSHQWDISPALTVSGGLRYNLFNSLGPQEVLTYLDGEPRNENNIADTLFFDDYKRIKTYSGLDFRLAAKYQVNSNFSVKASYNKLHQFIFLLSNTIALAPTDTWKLSDYNIEPMIGEQFSVGFYSNLLRNRLEFSAEAYYKKADNLVEFKDGANLVGNKYPEQEVLQGGLDSYGIEVMLKKPFGQLNGWVNYTYSRAKVRVDGPGEEERINFGDEYPANYDKPHAMNMVANYKFGRRFSISGNIVYATGRPVTLPTTVFYQNGIPFISYSRRNEFRVPDYFRFDLSAKIEGNLKSKKLIHSAWTFSIYNLTGRNNVYSTYFRVENGRIKGYKVSIFGSPIFSVTYNFKFGNYAD